MEHKCFLQLVAIHCSQSEHFDQGLGFVRRRLAGLVLAGMLGLVVENRRVLQVHNLVVVAVVVVGHK